MSPIENAAYVSVGRACGFAGLGVLCIVLGLSFDPVLAAKAGAILCLGIAVFLVWCGWRARERPYKKTEVWLILAKGDRPADSYAQRLVGHALREAYMRFAQQIAMIAAVFAGSALFLAIIL